MISLPFRAEGLEAEHPGCLKSFDSRQIDRFLTAIEEEFRAASAESGELQIQEIVVGNGSASHLTADDLTKMIRSLRTYFHVSPAARVMLTITPSGFDFYKLNAIRQLGNAAICLEIPALTDAGLRAGGYRCTAEKAEAALDCCYQNGFRRLSVFLTAKTMESAEAERTLNRILTAHPEALILREDADELLVRSADTILTQAGFSRAGCRWYRDGLPSPSRCTVQIGCGPNAVSVFDGCALRSTADFDFYCGHSDDFEALVQHAEADGV